MTAPAPRRCLWAVPVSDLGGVARHVLDVVAQGVPGWHVVVLVPPGPLAERCRAERAAVLCEPFGPDHGTARSVLTLRRAIRHLRPAIVHTHLAFADIVGAAAVAGAPAALVSTEHGIARDDLVYHATRPRSAVMAAVHTARLRRDRGVIAVSDATRRAVRAKWHPPASLPIEVIPNGLTPPPRPQTTAGNDAGAPGLRIGALARLAPEKGLLDLVDAFARVHRVHPEATLQIAGVGPLEHELRARIADLGLGASATLCGFVDPHDLLARVDVLAQLSVWENCPYAVLDALAAPTGVVATDVGGNPELLPARCLVPRGDAAAAADAMVEQGLKPDRRPSLPDGWPTVEQMCAATAAFYDQVAAA